MAVLVASAAIAWAATVRAQPLDSNDFGIDLAQPLVLGSGRAIGMSGALAATASGIEGVPWNAAAYASREIHQQTWFDWSLAFSMTFPGAFGNDDYFNNGLGRTRGIAVEDSAFVDVGFGLLFGDGGGGLLVRTQTYELVGDAGERIEIDAVALHMGAGYALFRGDLVLGIGTRFGIFDVVSAPTDESVIDLFGAGLEVGAQLRPNGAPWSAGLGVRAPVTARVDADGGPAPDVVAGYLVPRRVVLPWEIEAGVAYQIGARPLHVRREELDEPDDVARLELLREQCVRARAQSILEAETRTGAPSGEVAELPPDWNGRDCLGALAQPSDPDYLHDERARRAIEASDFVDRVERTEDRLELERQQALDALPRRTLLLAFDLVIYGRVENAIGLDAFFDQERRPRGASASVGYRLGVEGEPWPNRMKLRGGSYLEPSRNAGVAHRAHFTFGTDVRLFRWAPFGPADPWDFRVGSNFDVARDYFDIGFGVGFWH